MGMYTYMGYVYVFISECVEEYVIRECLVISTVRKCNPSICVPAHKRNY